MILKITYKHWNVPSLLPPFQEGFEPLLDQVLFKQKCLVPSLVENGQVVWRNLLKGWQYILTFSVLSP